MGSTGIYWQPVYELLESCFDSEIQLLVVNARHMKSVPGKKTDIRDSEWIATLLRARLLKRSFIPDKAFRELRYFTRYRKRLSPILPRRKTELISFCKAPVFACHRFDPIF